MTFDTIVARVCTRFNLTSDEAIARVGDEVNERYLEVLTSVGLITSTRSEGTALSEADSQYVTFGNEEGDEDGVLKVITVQDANVSETNPRILEEVDADEMVEESLISWPPSKWATYRVGPGYVIVKLNALAEEDDYELFAEVEESTVELSEDDEPQFSRNFHDILIHGAMSIEADKKEKATRQNRFEVKFEKRLSELRYHIATSAHRRMWSGRRPRRR